MIKLDALRVFVIVAQQGNIRDAAEKVHRTASAVSMTLKRLEEEVGGALFESDRKVSLTPLGAFLLETAIPQVASFDRAIESIKAFADNRTGALLLACVPSVAANLIAPVFSRFLEDRPGVTLELFDSDSNSVARMVETGEADIGIAGRPKDGGNVTFTPLFRDRFMVVCSERSHLPGLGRPIRSQDLGEIATILNGASKRIDDPGFRALGRTATLTVRNVTSLLALVKFGRGVTLLPALTCNALPEGVLALELADGRIGRVAGIIERKGTTPSPVAAAFRACLSAELAVLAQELNLEYLCGDGLRQAR